MSATPANLQFGGGPVMHVSNTYAIYWLPSGLGACPQALACHYEGYLTTGLGGSDSNYEALINRFLGDLTGSSYYNILTQYGDGNNGTAFDV
jgi:hypothetical protein